MAVSGEIRISRLGQDHRQSCRRDQDAALFPENAQNIRGLEPQVPEPLQIIWNRKIVDAIFRGGKKHSNYGNTAVNMITDIVTLIRKEYSQNVTIILLFINRT